MKQQWIIGDSLENSNLGFPHTPAEIAYAAGAAGAQAHAGIIACDTLMTQNYQINHAAIGQNIYPFLYSDFTPGGGRYTLLIDSKSSVSEEPTPPLYAQLKSVSHVPLGVWSIIVRYTQHPQGGPWIKPLADFGAAIATALSGLHDLGLDEAVSSDFFTVLTVMRSFINDAVSAGTFDITTYSELAMAINPQLLRMQALAAKIQVDAFAKTLDKWKTMTGPEVWAHLYVVISAQWTLSTENVHQLIISNSMSEEQAAKNIFVTSMPLTGIDQARTLCGRIVGDRIMAYQTLSVETERGRENIYSLSTSRDLISVAAEDAIKDLAALCPHMNGSKR